MNRITSRQNPRIKQLVRLWERRGREAAACFLIEGRRECERAFQAGVNIQEVFLCPALWRDETTCDLVEKLNKAGTLTTECTAEVFTKVSAREGPDGMLAVARLPRCELSTLKLPAEPLVLVIEQVEKPGNLGALLRTADATGVAAVICAEPRTDFFNPHVIRNSQGAVFSVPRASSDRMEVLSWLRSHRLPIVATTPAARQLYWDADLRSGLALCFGSEDTGLTQAWLDASDLQLGIPMLGSADSLNLSVSAAVCLYEALRQRRL